MSFVISIFSVFGMLFIILYTGYGLGALPFYLIKGKKSLATAHQEFEMDIAQIRERKRNLQEKVARKGALNQKEKKELSKLKQEEESISLKIYKISGLLESDQMINKILTILTPFRYLIGVVLLIISMLIFASLLTTSLDRLLHSKCGLDCGYVLDDMNYTNYLDFLLLYSSKYFHSDMILFAIVNIYVFFCSIYGFVRLGVKFFVFTWFEVKQGSTQPQGLLVMAFKISLMILAFMLQILTLAPQYSTFGTQKVSLGNIPCKLTLVNIYSSECKMSNISKFYNRISISLPFFSTIFYIANWLMIGIGLISLIYSALFRKEDVLEYISDDDEERKILINDN